MPPPCHATEINMLPAGGVSSTIGEDQGGQPGPRRGGRGRLVYRGEDGEGSGLFKDSRLVGQPCTVIAAPAARSSSISRLRTLVAKVKAYCERCSVCSLFKGQSVPVAFLSCNVCRAFRYDSNQSEYFVQTSDTVKVKRADLDRWMQASDAGDEASTRRIFIFFFVYTVGFRNAFAFLPGHAGQAGPHEADGWGSFPTFA